MLKQENNSAIYSALALVIESRTNSLNTKSHNGNGKNSIIVNTVPKQAFIFTKRSKIVDSFEFRAVLGAVSVLHSDNNKNIKGRILFGRLGKLSNRRQKDIVFFLTRLTH